MSPSEILTLLTAFSDKNLWGIENPKGLTLTHLVSWLLFLIFGFSNLIRQGGGQASSPPPTSAQWLILPSTEENDKPLAVKE